MNLYSGECLDYLSSWRKLTYEEHIIIRSSSFYLLLERPSLIDRHCGEMKGPLHQWLWLESPLVENSPREKSKSHCITTNPWMDRWIEVEREASPFDNVLHTYSLYGSWPLKRPDCSYNWRQTCKKLIKDIPKPEEARQAPPSKRTRFLCDIAIIPLCSFVREWSWKLAGSTAGYHSTEDDDRRQAQSPTSGTPTYTYLEVGLKKGMNEEWLVVYSKTPFRVCNCTQFEGIQKEPFTS